MADFSKFRTAVSGFNRTDVVNYIESTSVEHQKALRKLTDERDRLTGENASLQAQLTALTARLQAAQQENETLAAELQAAKQDSESLSAEVQKLSEEGAQMAEELKSAQTAAQHAAAEPAQPEQEDAAQAEPAAQDEPLETKELAAYRRAEQAERNAAVRARRIYQQLTNLCEDARSRYLDSGEEIAALAADLSTGLSRLQDAFAEVQVIFDDAQNSFDAMQLPETQDETDDT